MSRNEKTVRVEDLEIATPGFANGISTQLKALLDSGEHRSLNDEEKSAIIEDATVRHAT